MNPYSTMTERLVTTLQTDLAALGWTPLAVHRGIWKPRALPEFERYMVWVAPPPNNPWTEQREAIRASGWVAACWTSPDLPPILRGW